MGALAKRAGELEVSVASLQSLGCFEGAGGVLEAPLWNGDGSGESCGGQRRLRDGRKLNAPGSVTAGAWFGPEAGFGDAPVGVLCEGLSDAAVAVEAAAEGWSVVGAVSAAQMAAVADTLAGMLGALQQTVLVVVADPDTAGAKGAREAAQAWWAAGRPVIIVAAHAELDLADYWLTLVGLQRESLGEMLETAAGAAPSRDKPGDGFFELFPGAAQRLREAKDDAAALREKAAVEHRAASDVTAFTEWEAAEVFLKWYAEKLLLARRDDGEAEVFLLPGSAGVWRADAAALRQAVCDAYRSRLVDGFDGHKPTQEAVRFYRRLCRASGAVDGVVQQCIVAYRELLRDAQKSADAFSVDALDESQRSRLKGRDRRVRVVSQKAMNPPWYLGAENGVIDLTTGELLTGRAAADKAVTISVGFDHDPDAAHRDVDLLFGHLEDDDRDWLLAHAGQALTGEPKGFLAIEGETSHGKSTFVRAVAAALGDYAAELPAVAITAGAPQGGANPEFEGFARRRWLFMDERPSGGLSTVILKRYCVSGATVTYRRLYENYSPTVPVRATLALTWNDVQWGDGWGVADAALSRRMNAISVPKPPVIDQALAGRVGGGAWAGRRAMLALLVRVLVKTRGEPPPPSRRAAEAADRLRRASFGEDLCDWLDDAVVAGGEDDRLWANTLWAAGREERPSTTKNGAEAAFGMTRRTFSTRAATYLGLSESRVGKPGGVQGARAQRYWLGARLRDEQPPGKIL